MRKDTAQPGKPATSRSISGRPARRPPEIGPAPGRLELVRAFVNTLDIEEQTDELDSPAALGSWLAGCGLGDDLAADGPAGGSGGSLPLASKAEGTGSSGVWDASASDLRTAVAMREALRGVLLAHTDRDAQPVAAAAELASVAAGLPVRLEVDAGGAVRSAPAGSGATAGLAALLLIGAEAATAGAWARLKVCGADDCRWAFYDRSPARSGCWCSMAICGSRAKSRAYRRRSRPAEAQR